MDAFYVHESWSREGHGARLHRATCAHCTPAAGGSAKRQGRWHGPFAEIKDALAAAHKTGAAVRRCRYCKP